MAQGTRSPFIKLQFLTDSGVVAASHKLFVYSAGTTTKVTTYTDVDLSSANTNPIVLDSAGRCDIYLPVPGSYKYVLTTSGDSDPPVSPIWTQDNIFAVPLPPVATRKTGDQTLVTTTTFADVTNLSFAVGASETWGWVVYLHGVAPAAADWKFTFTGPAAPTAVRFGVVGVGAAGATGIGAQSASAFATAIQVEADSQEELIILQGYLRNGVNAGTVQLQAAQFFASGTSTIRAESIIIPTRYA